MHQPGIMVRPIRQLTGTSEFNEVFFDNARTPRDLVLGEPGDGWRVAMATLASSAACLPRSAIGYQREFDALVALARQTGAAGDPALRDRLGRAWIGLQVMREQVLADARRRRGPGGRGRLGRQAALVALASRAR